MPESKPKKRRIRGILLVAAVLFAATFAYLWPALRTVAPLVHARKFVAVCRTSDGSLLQVAVYRGMGLPDRVYLLIPTEDRYRWFAVDFHNSYVGTPGWPRSGLGITYVRTDQPAGVNLLDPKIEDTWEVVFNPRHVTFKNRSLDISLKATNDD
jgi:hypothetical protein